MSQTTEIQIQNQAGLPFRQKLNLMLSALDTGFAGATAPTVTEAYMNWLDTSTTPPTPKRRNAADSGWDTVVDSTAAAALPKAGGTMTGPIVLAADATLAMHPVTKQQLDAVVTPSRFPVAVRNTVQCGSTSGVIAIGTGLACNLLATSIPVNVAIAAGFNAYGALDYIARFTADQASFWTGLTASTTNYLFLDRNTSTGSVTGVGSVLPYITQPASVSNVPSVVSGQHTYQPDTGLMYVGNGTTASQVQRTPIGYAVAGTSTITSVVTYAFNRVYDSGWTNTLPIVAVTKNHNIGVDSPLLLNLSLKCLTAEFGYSVGDIITNVFTYNNTYDDPIVIWNSRLSAGFMVNPTGSYRSQNKTGSSVVTLTLANWAFKLSAGVQL